VPAFACHLGSEKKTHVIQAMMRWYGRLRKVMLLPAVAIPILAIGVAVGVMGFWSWYGLTLALYPVWQWPFVPDCPLYALLFVPALVLILLGRARKDARTRGAPRYNAWVAFGLIKYGTWTVLMWVLYWINTGGHFTAEGVVMTFSHLGMILEGLFLLSFAEMDWLTVVACAAWYGLSDWMDYGVFQTYPRFDTRIVPLGLMQWHTIGMTILLTGLYICRQTFCVRPRRGRPRRGRARISAHEGLAIRRRWSGYRVPSAIGSRAPVRADQMDRSDQQQAGAT
jgi:uncharacterized membrane protein YpjA